MAGTNDRFQQPLPRVVTEGQRREQQKRRGEVEQAGLGIAELKRSQNAEQQRDGDVNRRPLP
ncbi:MAG TPA: hypothetical protein VEW07_13040 [Solirubrobacterales bacterium]|nr:hypothetical protein [Solirubrobacterales bacterium]